MSWCWPGAKSGKLQVHPPWFKWPELGPQLFPRCLAVTACPPGFRHAACLLAELPGQGPVPQLPHLPHVSRNSKLRIRIKENQCKVPTGHWGGAGQAGAPCLLEDPQLRTKNVLSGAGTAIRASFCPKQGLRERPAVAVLSCHLDWN